MDIARNTHSLQVAGNSLVRLHIICAGLQSNVTEHYANLLRDSGTAITSTHVSTIDELDTSLQSSLVDLVICDGNNTQLPLDKVISTVQQFNEETALIVSGDSSVLSNYSFGITDIVNLEDETRTLHQLNKSIQNLLKDQKLRSLEKQKNSFEKRCLMLMNSSREAICYSHEGMHVFANPSYLEMFGISTDDDEIESVTLMDLVDPEYHQDLKRMLKLSQQANEKEYSLEVGCKRSDDSSFTADMTFSPVLVDDERSVQIIVREKASESATAMPNIDLLTGLYSSNYFQGCASEIVDTAKSKEKCYALFYLAINKYMQMRETVGLTQSNEIIKQIADLLGNTLKSEMRSTLSRIGDHAFAFIAPAKNRDMAEKVGQKLAELVSQQNYEGISETNRPTVSIGIALSENDIIADGSDFIDLAYHAYSRVADTGEAISIYGEEPPQAAEETPKPVAAKPINMVGSEEAESVDLVKYALDNDKLSYKLFALLNLDGESGKSNYFVELYFHDDKGEATSSNEIREAVAGSGKSVQIDNKLLRKIGELAKKNASESHIFHMPISADTMVDEGFISRLGKVMQHYGIKAGSLSFLLDGHDVRHHLTEAKRFCTQVRQLGCGCFMRRFAEREDDLALVRDIPVTGVWFSKKLSEGFSSNENKLQRLKDLGNVMKTMNLSTILGNISSPSDLANAWGIGVDFICGPFLHKGSDVPDFDFSRYC